LINYSFPHAIDQNQVSLRKGIEKMNKSNDSKVPRFTFPSKLIEQAEALKTNPIMQRFALSRERLSEDPYRPIYHFVSPESGMNDPNGLCFWRGFWHLFYQGYPIEDTKRVYWGHSYSEDLIHWKDLPYAIYPDIEGSCFSGSTYVEDNRVLAMYHGTDSGNFVATSQDDLLLNWEKLTGGPVIPILNPDGTERNFLVFDPFIWKQGNYYYSISNGHAPKIINGIRRRTDSLLRSSDRGIRVTAIQPKANRRTRAVGEPGNRAG
jgi:beta-fructofuranosidase